MDKPNHPGLKTHSISIVGSKVFGGFSSIIDKISGKYSFKKILIGVMLIVIVGLLLTTYKINEIKTRAFTVYFGDEEIGIVRDQEQALSILSDIKKELSNTYDIDIVFKKDVRFEDTHAKDDLIVSPAELKSNIKSRMTFLVSGYALMVDNKEIGFARTKEDLENIIETIKKPYLDGIDENSDIEKISFIEDVKIEKKDIPLNKLNNKEELLQYIQTGTEEVKTHVVEVGESLWTIAKIYDMSVEELIEANLDKNPEKTTNW